MCCLDRNHAESKGKPTAEVMFSELFLEAWEFVRLSNQPSLRERVLFSELHKSWIL